jgi:RNA polymerase sigma-70 factor (ECF subfamily)
VHRRWLDFDAERPLRPWLFGIAYRVAATHRKRTRREALDPCLEIEDLAPRPDEAFAIEQARALVLAALARIPLPRRAVLVMHDLDGAEMRDVAAALSIPLFTAYSRLRKARKELQASVASLTGQPKGELR